MASVKTRFLLVSLALLVLVSTPAPARAQFVPFRGIYNGLMFETNGLWQQSSGYISIQTTPRGTYSGTLRVGAGRYAFSGRLDTNGQGSRDILRYGQYPLTLTFQIDPNDPDLIAGTVTDGIWRAEMIADRVVFDGVSNVSPDVGRYTLVIPGDVSQADAPGGDSFGTVQINKAGRISFWASLADGRKVTQSTTISKGGQWPLHLSLYGGNGALYGWMLLNDPAGEDVSGDVTWIKPQRANDWFYPDGFAISVYAWGSRYTAPPAGTPILSLNLAQLEFTGGDLYRNITNRFSLDARNRVTNYGANGLKLKFSPGNGTFSGKVQDPITWDWLPFGGVVLQRYNFGAGYFPGWNHTGEVWFEAAPGT